MEAELSSKPDTQVYQNVALGESRRSENLDIFVSKIELITVLTSQMCCEDEVPRSVSAPSHTIRHGKCPTNVSYRY